MRLQAHRGILADDTEASQRMQFLVIAHDGTDEGAPARRMAVREKHLEVAKGLHGNGILQLGGALLSESGSMVGSAMVIEADSEEALREMLSRDPYTHGGAWQRFEIWPFRRAF